MVVYLAVDGKHLLAVGREQRLSARFGIDYRQAFVSQNGRTSAVYTAPVRTAMTNLTAHAQSLLAQLGSLFPKVENRYNSTHIFVFFYWFLLFVWGCIFRMSYDPCLFVLKFKDAPLPREAEGIQDQKNSHYFRSAHLLNFLTPHTFSCRHSHRARICRDLPLQRVGRHAFR